MKPTTLVMGGAGLALLAFSRAGLNTSGGRRFDEMAGMIRLVARIAGLLLIIGAAVPQFLIWRRTR